MVSTSIWTQRVNGRNECLISTSLWSQRVYDFNECMVSTSVWSQRVYDPTLPRSPSYVDAYTSHEMTPATKPPRHPTDTPPPVVRCHVIESEIGMTQEPTTTPRALKSQPTSMSMARMMRVMGTSRHVALVTHGRYKHRFCITIQRLQFGN